MSTMKSKASQPVIYRVHVRGGLSRDVTNKREALARAAAERRDGWDSYVTDLRTGERVRRA